MADTEGSGALARSGAAAERAPAGKLGAARLPCMAQRWIEIHVCTEAGEPLDGLRVRIVDPSGTQHDCALDADGVAGLEDIEPGECQVSFPDVPVLELAPRKCATAARHEFRVPDWDLERLDDVPVAEHTVEPPIEEDEPWDLAQLEPVPTQTR